MLPFVFNDDPNRLVQLTMNGSVGAGGRNEPTDVKLVQTLLNAIPPSERGPEIKLTVDGVAGPKTFGAIRRFQQAHTNVADGRIDVGGRTIQTLVRLLNERNQLPHGLPNLGPPDPRIARGLNGTGERAVPVRFSDPSYDPPIDPEWFGFPLNWKIVSSGGFDVSVSVFGATHINIYMEQDSQPGVRYRFLYDGIGAALSYLPAGINISGVNLPSWGTRLRKGLAGRNPCPADDFKAPATVYTIGGTYAAGWSGAIILFGCYGPFWFSTRALAALTGAQLGSPNAGIAGYFGYISAWT